MKFLQKFPTLIADTEAISHEIEVIDEAIEDIDKAILKSDKADRETCYNIISFWISLSIKYSSDISKNISPFLAFWSFCDAAILSC